MMRDEVLRSTREGLLTAEAQAAHLDRLRTRLPDLTPGRTWSDAQFEAAYAFQYLFVRLHDILQHRMFRGTVALVGEDAEAHSAQSLALRLEKLGAIADHRLWLDLTSLRNSLVNDYPVGEDALLRHLSLAREAAPDLIAILDRLVRFLRLEGFVE